MNTLLTFSEKKNVFTAYSLEQAENELKPQIDSNQYTEELKVLLTLSSSPLLIDGVDPTEIPKANSQKNLFNKIKNVFKQKQNT
ncbi:hypothetical protein KAW08_01210 [bacterium]|nr:hypothetical protein [bacterium]